MVGMQEKRLLVCDDEPGFGRFVKNVAEDLGYTVHVTTDGRALIEAYGSFKPTTIVLDMIMPGMDGNEVVAWLAQQKSTARLISSPDIRRTMQPTPRCWRNTRGLVR